MLWVDVLVARNFPTTEINQLMVVSQWQPLVSWLLSGNILSLVFSIKLLREMFVSEKSSYLNRLMLYYSSFGFMEESTKMVLGFLIVSVATALVESHPLSSELDDNLTVPLTAVLVGSLVF